MYKRAKHLVTRRRAPLSGDDSDFKWDAEEIGEDGETEEDADDWDDDNDEVLWM